MAVISFMSVNNTIAVERKFTSTFNVSSVKLLVSLPADYHFV